MAAGYERASLADLETRPDKPGRRWELSPELGIAGYNLNVAVVPPGERLSQTAYHAHERQEEVFLVVEGTLRVEVANGSFDLETDEVIRFGPGVVHLLHNPFDDPARVIAIGYPAEGRRPVRQVQGYAELLAERYPGGDPATGPADVQGSGGPPTG